MRMGSVVVNDLNYQKLSNNLQVDTRHFGIIKIVTILQRSIKHVSDKELTYLLTGRFLSVFHSYWVGVHSAVSQV